MPHRSNFSRLCFFGSGSISFSEAVLRCLRAFDGANSSLHVEDGVSGKQYSLVFSAVDEALLQDWRSEPVRGDAALLTLNPHELYCFSMQEPGRVLTLSMLFARSELSKKSTELSGLWRLEFKQHPDESVPDTARVLKELTQFGTPSACRFEHDPDVPDQQIAAAHFQVNMKPLVEALMPVLAEELHSLA